MGRRRLDRLRRRRARAVRDRLHAAADRATGGGPPRREGDGLARSRARRRRSTADRSSLADLAGNVVVVNFWATWCKPCREEQPELERVLAATIATGASTFLGVNERDDTAKPPARGSRSSTCTYPSIVDESGSWADDFALFGYPDTYVVDAAGHDPVGDLRADRRGAQLRRCSIDGVLVPSTSARCARPQRPIGASASSATAPNSAARYDDRVREHAPRAIRRRLAPQPKRPVHEDAAEHDRGAEVDRPHVPDRVQQQRRRRTARASRGRSDAASRPRPSRRGASARPPPRSRR